MKRFLPRLLLLLAVLAILAAMIAATGWWYAHRPLALAAERVDFTVARGMGMRQAAAAIERAGVGVDARLLALLARLTKRDARIKAGSYEVHAGITPWQLILKLSDGDVTQGELLLVEGWTFRQVRQALESHPDLEADTAGLGEAEILARIGASAQNAEGLFFPDTYLFDKRSGALAVLRRAHEAMQARLDKAWAERDPATPLASPYEALILASIVEKETALPSERPLVAGVYATRLRRGMRLQSDPTVIYGIGASYDGDIRTRDLPADTPYNTYVRAGLPPTPIALPGRGALLAATAPRETGAVFFVATGNPDGSHFFSSTYEEHRQGVARMLERQRAREREARSAAP